MDRATIAVFSLVASVLPACSPAAPPLATSGSYWKSTSASVPDVLFASDGTGKMTFNPGGPTPQFVPVDFTWTTLAADSVSVGLKLGPAPAAPSGLEARYAGADPGAKPGEMTLSWSPVAGADFYNVYITDPGSSGSPVPFYYQSKATFTYDGPSVCGVVTPNYDGTYGFKVTAVQAWVEGPAASASATVSGNPAPTGSSGSPSEGCTVQPPNAPTDNSSIPDLDPTRFTSIGFDDPSSPTSMSATVVTANGTQTWQFTLASGSF